MQQTLEASFLAIFAHQRDAFMFYDAAGEVTVQNDAAARLRAISSWDDITQESAASTAFVEAYKGLYSAFEMILPSNEGEMRIRADLAPVFIDGKIAGISAVVRDIRPTLSFDLDALFDGALPSLGILYDRMSRLLIYMRREGRPFAVHLVSVRAADAQSSDILATLEPQIISRLLETVRGSDTVARMGRNFVVVQAELVDHEGVNFMTNRLRNVLETPLRMPDGTSINLKAYVGTAIASRRTSAIDDLLAEADLALSRQCSPAGVRNINRA